MSVPGPVDVRGFIDLCEEDRLITEIHSSPWISSLRPASAALRAEWVRRPKLVCIDIQHYGTTQAPERADILNIGGFVTSCTRSSHRI